MSPDSSRREELFGQIGKIEEEARRKALRYLPIYLPLSILPGKIGDKFLGSKTAPYRHRVASINNELRTIEFEEDFPVVREYLEAIDNLADFIPEHLRKAAYYPMAGFDIFWSKVFQNVLMEDRNYDIEHDRYDLWWEQQDYNTEGLLSLLENLKMREMIPNAHKISLIAADSEKGQNYLRFNDSDTTLIYKGAHTFLNYARKMNSRKHFTFGAVLLSGDDPSTPPEKVNTFMSNIGYELAYDARSRIPEYGSPWAIEIIDPRIFLKTQLLNQK